VRGEREARREDGRWGGRQESSSSGSYQKHNSPRSPSVDSAYARTQPPASRPRPDSAQRQRFPNNGMTAEEESRAPPLQRYPPTTSIRPEQRRAMPPSPPPENSRRRQTRREARDSRGIRVYDDTTDINDRNDGRYRS